MKLTPRIARVPTLVVLLPAALFVMSASGCHNAAAPTPPPAQNALGIMKMRWLPMVVAHHQIVAVNNQTLPAPIALPLNLTPLGNVCLVTVPTDKTKAVVFNFFFKADQEPKVKAWASSVLQHFPLKPGTYRVNPSSFIAVDPSNQQSWHGGAGAIAKGIGGVVVDFFGSPTQNNIAPADATNHDAMIMHTVMMDPINPVAKEPRTITLMVRYVNLLNRQ